LLTLTGHSGFIFRIVYYQNYIFSAGDDNVLKVWYDNKFIMNLHHPNTVWDVTVNSLGGLATACEDEHNMNLFKSFFIVIDKK
jgi:WD40 repeat protein